MMLKWKIAASRWLALLFLGVLVQLTGILAQAQMEGMMGNPTDPKAAARIHGSLYGEAPSGDARQILGLSQHGGSVTAPFYKNDEDSLAFSLTYSELDIATQAALPSQRKIPELLSSASFGLTYAQKLEGKKFWAINGSFGSASDQPFSHPNVDTLGANLFATITAEEESSWLFILNYSNNRPILNNIPIPGFAYQYTPSKTFRGLFGFPFAFMRWEFQPQWTWSFFVATFSVVKTEFAYSVAGPVQIFTSFDFSQQPFLMRDRENTKDRLFYDEKKWAMGIRSPLSKELFADLSGGVAFDRNFFEAENYQKADQNRMAVGATWFAAASLSARF